MAEKRIEPPFFPIIYVRGYAGTDAEVEATVADPYMGFNLGATKLRKRWTGAVEKHFFESALVRLMKDHDYHDVYKVGSNMPPELAVGPRSIVIYRYYDQVSEAFGEGKRVAIEDFARGLNDLVLKLRDRVRETCDNPDDFRVYLVGHSMGGLVIRAFLQNDVIGAPEAKRLVDKVFTYATPHNGIEAAIIGNVPGFFSANNANNFNRERMAEYLGLPKGTEPVNTLNGRFDADRFFCLIGTDAKDYAAGWSARLVGPFSDGLVRINNAFVTGPTEDPKQPVTLAPRAYVYRSHSGPFGIVNSEEGYQNLMRFLFGDVRVDGHLEVARITLPPEVEAARREGKEIRASYDFEAVVGVRGASWDLSRRLVAENSSVFRRYGELFPEKKLEGDRPFVARPQLFTAFLSAAARVKADRPSLGFAIDLGVQVPDYEVDGVLWLDQHYPGGYIFRDKITLEAIPPQAADAPWRLLYGFDSETPNHCAHEAERRDGDGFVAFSIPVVRNAEPGIEAALVLTARPWNH